MVAAAIPELCTACIACLTVVHLGGCLPTLPQLLASRPPRTAPRSNLIPRPGACISSAPSSPSRSAYLADPTTIHTFQTTSFSAAGAVEGASPQPKVGARVGCGTRGWLAGSLVLAPDQAAVWRASNALLF